MDGNEKSLTICVVLGLLLFFSLLFGMFVYNHGNDIGRDEFYATNCKYVSKVDDSNGLATTTKYLCEGK